jgi:hypothetical protein
MLAAVMSPRFVSLPKVECAYVKRKTKNPAAVALGRLGGLAAAGAGGRALAAKMTPDERSASARRAVLARWRKAARRRKTTKD